MDLDFGTFLSIFPIPKGSKSFPEIPTCSTAPFANVHNPATCADDKFVDFADSKVSIVVQDAGH